MLLNPGAIVYGTITIGALLAAESAQHETYAETVGAVLIALLLYWLAHAYSELAAERLEHHEAFTVTGVVSTLVSELMIIVGAAVPLLTLVVCWAAGFRLATAVAAAVSTAAAMIVIEEAVTGVRAHLSRRALVVQIAVGIFFGLLVLSLSLLLHP